MCFGCCGCVLLGGDCVIKGLIALTLWAEMMDDCTMCRREKRGKLKKKKRERKKKGEEAGYKNDLGMTAPARV
jgi:hypothetical protein